MRKVITTTLLAASISMGLGLPTTQVLASPENEVQVSQKSAEHDLLEALKTQVALAEARVSLLQARSDLWLQQNKDAAIRSLDEARAKLDEGWKSANQITQSRITALKLEADKAKVLLKEKGQGAEDELRKIADRSESALNAALAQAQSKSATLKDKVSTRYATGYALGKARASALEAKISVQLDNASEATKQALEETVASLKQAKTNATKATLKQITQLQVKAEAAQQAVIDKATSAKSKINDLVTSTEESLKTYEMAIKETDEARLLQKRYGQLEAKTALLKANLVEKSDVTKTQVTSYLDESKAWYNSLKSKTKESWNKKIAEMTASIDEAKQAVKSKDKQLRAKLSELIERATSMFKDEEPAQ